jgi:hypothetical protein
MSDDGRAAHARETAEIARLRKLDEKNAKLAEKAVEEDRRQQAKAAREGARPKHVAPVDENRVSLDTSKVVSIGKDRG